MPLRSGAILAAIRDCGSWLSLEAGLPEKDAGCAFCLSGKFEKAGEAAGNTWRPAAEESFRRLWAEEGELSPDSFPKERLRSGVSATFCADCSGVDSWRASACSVAGSFG